MDGEFNFNLINFMMIQVPIWSRLSPYNVIDLSLTLTLSHNSWKLDERVWSAPTNLTRNIKQKNAHIKMPQGRNKLIIEDV